VPNEDISSDRENQVDVAGIALDIDAWLAAVEASHGADAVDYVRAICVGPLRYLIETSRHCSRRSCCDLQGGFCWTLEILIAKHVGAKPERPH
jgi:hypothetical protein